MKISIAKPNLKNPRGRRWASYLWHEAILKSRGPIAPAFTKPEPAKWSDARVTAAWLGHSTVLLNVFGVKILTDPVLFARIGIRVPFLFTLGPKRLTAPALTVKAPKNRHHSFIACALRSHRLANTLTIRLFCERGHRSVHTRPSSMDQIARRD